MKTSIKFLSLLLVACTVFISCSTDDDPSDNDLFIGRYDGSISFTSSVEGDTNVATTDGHVTVAKVGDTYTFSFSHSDIPTLGDIQMERGDNTTLIISNDELGVIRITESSLNIAYADSEGRAWTADGTR